MCAALLLLLPPPQSLPQAFEKGLAPMVLVLFDSWHEGGRAAFDHATCRGYSSCREKNSFAGAFVTRSAGPNAPSAGMNEVRAYTILVAEIAEGSQSGVGGPRGMGGVLHYMTTLLEVS